MRVAWQIPRLAHRKPAPRTPCHASPQARSRASLDDLQTLGEPELDAHLGRWPGCPRDKPSGAGAGARLSQLLWPVCSVRPRYALQGAAYCELPHPSMSLTLQGTAAAVSHTQRRCQVTKQVLCADVAPSMSSISVKYYSPLHCPAVYLRCIGSPSSLPCIAILAALGSVRWQKRPAEVLLSGDVPRQLGS